MKVEPTLRHANPIQLIEIHTDASGVDLSAVLLQLTTEGARTVAFASKTLNLAQRNYGVTELELLAVVSAIEELSPCFSGNVPFIVVIDYHAVVPLLKD